MLEEDGEDDDAEELELGMYPSHSKKYNQYRMVLLKMMLSL